MAWAWIRWRLILLMMLNMVAALVESLGILLFLPFFSRLGISNTNSEVSFLLHDFWQTFGTELSLAGGLAVLVGIFLIKGLLVFSIQYYRRTVLNSLELDLREDVVRHFSELDARYAALQSTGYFGHVVVHETHAARSGIESLCSLLGSAITAGVLIVAALTLDAGLSLFVLMSSGVSLLLLRFLARGVRRHSSTITGLEGRLSEFIIEALQAFPYLKATQRFDVLRERLTSTSQRTRRERNRMDRVLSMHLAIQEPLLVMLIAVMFYGAVQWLDRSVATVMVSLAFFYRCMIEMRLLQNDWQMVSVNSGGLNAVWQALSDMRGNRENVSGRTVPAKDLSIQLDGISFAYDRVPVLQDLSLSIPANRITALVGESGSGKTTLIYLLTGLLQPEEGEIRVGDHPLRALDLAAYRRRIGYVPQEPVILSGTVFENITLMPGRPQSEIRKAVENAARLAHCHDFISKMPGGYQTPISERGNTLSGGQRQRLAIARELFRRPGLLILDEAASALDSGSEKFLQESLEELKGSVTVLVISHRLSTIRTADKIHVLDKGKIAASGSFEDLVKQSSHFLRMCEHQNLV